MSSGWICLHRSFLKWEWWEDANTSRLYIYLLLSANHKPNKWQGILIERGQLITGLRALNKATGISIQSLRTSLERLISTGEITRQSTSRYSIITVCNYDKYQDLPVEDNKQINTQPNKQPTSSQQASNNKQQLNNKTKKQDNKINTPEKNPHGENGFVLLTVEEETKLIQKYSSNCLDDAIDILDAWIASKPGQLSWFKKKYSSAFAVLNPKSCWVWDKIKKPTRGLTKSEQATQTRMDIINQFRGQ
jgi:hypothetical protein